MAELIYKQEAFRIIGACLEVHKNLGFGFLEPVYQEALEHELKMDNVPFEREKELIINYKGINLRKKYIADFVCFGKIIVELKSLSSLTTEHEAQVLNYLKATGFKLGLLINFGQPSLEFKRLIY
jgi:GxxExxY protein